MICKECKEEKDYHAKELCKLCYHRLYDRQWRNKNPNYLKNWLKENPEKNIVYQKKWSEKNPNYYRLDYQKNKQRYNNQSKEDYYENKEKYKFLNRIWKQNNKDKDRVIQKRYCQTHKEQLRLHQSNRELVDINFKLRRWLSCRVSAAVKNQNSKKAYRTMKLLGCSVQECRQHLEKQFKLGMSWDNYKIDGWHIDHIIPCSKFNLLDLEEQKKCFHYTNLQPLWAIDNLKKGNKII